MIRKYTDHAANERTYLAWIRTAIALMTFGFIVEKFELFMVSLAGMPVAPSLLFSSYSMQVVGAGLFVFGLLLIISATIRFFVYHRAIESDLAQPYGGKKTMLFLSLLMIIIALFLFFYIGQRVIS